MNSRKIFGYGLIAVKVMLAVLLALTAFSCDDANGNGTKVQSGQVTLPQGLQGKTYTESGGGSITFGSDSVTVTSSDGTSHTYKIKSQERTGNKTKLKFSDNAGKDYIVVSDNGTIEEVVFDEVSGEGEWTYSSGNNPNPNEPVLEERVMFYFYDSDSDSGNTLWQWSFPFGSKVSLAQNVYYREPTKEDYDFIGWYTERNGDTLYDFDTVLTKENVQPEMENIDGEIKQTGWCVKVYAGWKVHVYTFEEMCFKYIEFRIGGEFVFEEDISKIDKDFPFYDVLDARNIAKDIDSLYYITFGISKPQVYSTPRFIFNMKAFTYGDDGLNKFNEYIQAHEYLKDDPIETSNGRPSRLPLNIVSAESSYSYYKYDKNATVYDTVFNGYQRNEKNYVVTDSEGMFKVTRDNLSEATNGRKFIWTPSENIPFGTISFLSNCSEQFHPGIEKYYLAWAEIVETIKPYDFVITGYEFDYENNRFAWIELGEHAFMKPGKYVYFERD